MKCPDGGGTCTDAYCVSTNRCFSQAAEDGTYSVRDDPDPGPFFPGDDPFSAADRN